MFTLHLGSVVEQLEVGGFFSESITKQHLFATVHDAVLFCLDHCETRTLVLITPFFIVNISAKHINCNYLISGHLQQHKALDVSQTTQLAYEG